MDWAFVQVVCQHWCHTIAFVSLFRLSCQVAGPFFLLAWWWPPLPPAKNGRFIFFFLPCFNQYGTVVVQSQDNWATARCWEFWYSKIRLCVKRKEWCGTKARVKKKAYLVNVDLPSSASRCFPATPARGGFPFSARLSKKWRVSVCMYVCT